MQLSADRGERPTGGGADEILSTGEAAAFCGVSRSTLRRAVAQGQLVAWHTPGRHLRFSRAVCEDFARRLGRLEGGHGVDVVGRAHERGSAAVQPASESPATPPTLPAPAPVGRSGRA